ncbi:MAG TPA: hypothetical protein VGQ41_13620 [Pyrinomonadaceae bacterium]|nr:hypothetical protein [Pyrinomonadaceae bacterium]
MNRVSTVEVLDKAYRLAYFLHQDKGVAIRIVAAATLKLNVAMAVQSKRLYYIPVGRFSPGELRRTDGIRNKTLFSDLHLLQRLIYGESEPYERQKELAAQAGVRADGDRASDEDLLVYFVKHLVRITTKRNAFYVTLGVSRLLHSYSTLETMEIYNAVIGEPERVKDDYYYRSRKAVLMHEMSQRFGQLIRACRQRRGEERFETQQGSSEQRSLVRDCLRLFTPWDTQCPVPNDFDPLKTVIARLTSKNSDDENRVEVNRIHAVLHPDCFGRLVAAFGYCAPPERMELPRFFSQHSDDQSPPRPRSAPTELSAEELAEINHILGEQAGRRRRSSPTAVIRIIVDGIERARLNPAEQSSITFTTQEDSETIEVKTADPNGDLLLATHLLNSYGDDAHDKTIVSSIRLEGGQKLSLSIKRQPIKASGPAELLVQFSYRETDPRRAARLWWQRLSRRLNLNQRQPNSRSLWGGARISARYVFVVSVVVTCLASYLVYVRLRTQQTSGPAQTSAVQTTNPPSSNSPPEVNDRNNGVDNTAAKATGPDRSASQQTRRNRNGKSSAAKARAGEDVAAKARDEDAADVTRSGDAVPNLALREVKKIYIEMRGYAASNDLRDKFVETLNSSGIVAASTNADDADAALKIMVTQTSAGPIEASALLVNARGTVLWPKAGRGALHYSGEISRIVSEIVNDLLSEIRLAK